MWIESLKKHVTDEVYYSPEMKAHLIGLVNSIPADDPETFLSGLINQINAAGQFRSRELGKFIHRVLYQYRTESKALPAVERLTLLDNIILGRR